MRNSYRLKFVPSLAVAASLALTACAADDAEEATNPDNVCGDEDWCEPADVEGAYDDSHARLFCNVEKVRSFVSEGDRDVAQLVERMPQWGTNDDREGEPVIVDVSRVPMQDTGAVFSELDLAVRNAGWYQEYQQYEFDVDSCVGETTQETIQVSEGLHDPQDSPGES